jgi:hypothetical protein
MPKSNAERRRELNAGGARDLHREHFVRPQSDRGFRQFDVVVASSTAESGSSLLMAGDAS